MSVLISTAEVAGRLAAAHAEYRRAVAAPMYSRAAR
jgi:hypothetical protein